MTGCQKKNVTTDRYLQFYQILLENVLNEFYGLIVH